MMFRLASLMWTAAALTAIGSSAMAADWGNLSGQIVLDGAVPEAKILVRKGDPAARDAAVCAKEEIKDASLVVDPATKGIANVVVYLTKAPKSIHPDLKGGKTTTVEFDNQACVFVPRVIAAQAGQPIKVMNTDAVAHNVHTYSTKNTAVNFLVQPGNSTGIPLKGTEQERVPFKVVCDIHPWMLGHWMICDHPYFAVTGPDGKFTIENLPAGEEIEVRIWQERAGYVQKPAKMTLKAGANDLGAIKAPLDSFNK